MKKTVIVLFVALILFSGCGALFLQDDAKKGNNGNGNGDGDGNQNGKDTATELTANIWTDGNITSIEKEQWFKFTATDTTQLIHVKLDTLTDLYVQLYTKGDPLGSRTEFNTFSSTPRFTKQTLITGQDYYIKVTPYGGSSYKGTYMIAFNTSDTAPALP